MVFKLLVRFTMALDCQVDKRIVSKACYSDSLMKIVCLCVTSPLLFAAGNINYWWPNWLIVASATISRCLVVTIGNARMYTNAHGNCSAEFRFGRRLDCGRKLLQFVWYRAEIHHNSLVIAVCSGTECLVIFGRELGQHKKWSSTGTGNHCKGVDRRRKNGIN